MMVVNGLGVYAHVTGERMAELMPSAHILNKSLCYQCVLGRNLFGIFNEFELRNCIGK